MKQKNEIALIVRRPEFDLQSAARSHTRQALRVLVEIMSSKDASPTARAAAAKVLRRHLKVIGGSMSDDLNNLVTNSLKRPAEMYRSPRTRPHEH
jgi:hypothetical protein